MTIRRSTPIVDTAALRRDLLVSRARAAYAEADDREAARVMCRVMPDGTVVVGVAEAPAPAASAPAHAPADVAARIAALRSRLNGGAFRPVGR